MYNALKERNMDVTLADSKRTRIYVVIVNRSLLNKPGSQTLKYWTLPIGDLVFSQSSWSARLVTGKSTAISINDAWRRLVAGIDDYERHITQGLNTLLPEFCEPGGTPTTFFSNKKASTAGIKAIQSRLRTLVNNLSIHEQLDESAEMPPSPAIPAIINESIPHQSAILSHYCPHRSRGLTTKVLSLLGRTCHYISAGLMYVPGL